MMFPVIIIGSAVIASIVAAAPEGSHLADRVVGRFTSYLHRRNPPILTGKSPITETINGADVTDVITNYDRNWAGAQLTPPPVGQNFTAVSAQFIVPVPALPSDAKNDTTYWVSAWVGIDGYPYGNAILQTGIEMGINASDGSILYQAWYEWYPRLTSYFEEWIEINAGDELYISVTATSASTGVAEIFNLSQDSGVSKELTAPSNSSHLAGQSADWIVEDFTAHGKYVPLANFTTVSFTQAVAQTSNGTTISAGDASNLWDMTSNVGKLWTNVEVSGEVVNVTYVK